jgi:hypothetical protein
LSAWIKWTKELETDPRVTRMVRDLKRRNASSNADRNAQGDAERNADFVTSVTSSVTSSVTVLTLVCGALVRLWSFADTHVRSDNTIDLGFSEIDELVGVPGFTSVMPKDWLIEIDPTTVELPNFQEHNGVVAKKNALNAKRQANYRSRNSVTQSVTGGGSTALPRPDQTRLEETKSSSPTSGSDTSVADSRSLAATTSGLKVTRKAKGPKPSRTMPSDFPVEEHRKWAAENHPSVDFDREMAKLRDHTFRTAHIRWGGVIRNWIRTAEERASARPSGPHGSNASQITPHAERDALAKLKARRSKVRGLAEFRDPIPGETAAQYREAQDAEWTRYQDSQRDLVAMAKAATKGMP